MRSGAWLNRFRLSHRSSFTASLETGDFDLRYGALFRYSWRLNPDSRGAQPIAPNALARHVLREIGSAEAIRYRLFDCERAEDAINALLCDELSDPEDRILIEGSVRLAVPKSARAIMEDRMAEEVEIRSVFARETIQLELLLDRLTDPSIGPVWWVNRYADIQFATGDPKAKVTSVLEAFAELRRVLDAASANKTADPQLRVRRKLDEIFTVIEDPQALSLALDLMNRFLHQMGVQRTSGTHDPSSRR